ncbi:MAG TPA: ester cyclase [Chloroflexota bacterium]|nr:ester cyclase [Chloroflexota bacterium]
MSLEDNKALVRRGIQTFNTRDWAHFADIFTPDAVFHGTLPGLALGPRGARELAAKVGSAWPDDQWVIENLIGEGERVVAHISSRATHLGRWLGIAATGRPVQYEAVWIFRIEEGRIAEAWWFADDLSRLKQVGAEVFSAAVQ